MMDLIRKWISFFSPVEGWKDRYRAFHQGQRMWPNALVEGAPTVFPWPLEWLPHEKDESTKSGFIVPATVCVDTKKEVEEGLGISCARCGVPLHSSAIKQTDYFSPPFCKRCHVLVHFLPL